MILNDLGRKLALHFDPDRRGAEALRERQPQPIEQDRLCPIGLHDAAESEFPPIGSR